MYGTFIIITRRRLKWYLLHRLFVPQENSVGSWQGLEPWTPRREYNALTLYVLKSLLKTKFGVLGFTQTSCSIQSSECGTRQVYSSHLAYSASTSLRISEVHGNKALSPLLNQTKKQSCLY